MSTKIGLFLFSCFITSPFLLFSQDLTNSVVSTAGDDSQCEHAEISWTLGECVTDIYFGQTYIFSQGFHQPEVQISEIHEENIPVFSVSV